MIKEMLKKFDEKFTESERGYYVDGHELREIILSVLPAEQANEERLAKYEQRHDDYVIPKKNIIIERLEKLEAQMKSLELKVNYLTMSPEERKKNVPPEKCTVYRNSCIRCGGEFWTEDGMACSCPKCLSQPPVEKPGETLEDKVIRILNNTGGCLITEKLTPNSCWCGVTVSGQPTGIIDTDAKQYGKPTHIFGPSEVDTEIKDAGLNIVRPPVEKPGESLEKQISDILYDKRGYTWDQKISQIIKVVRSSSTEEVRVSRKLAKNFMDEALRQENYKRLTPNAMLLLNLIMTRINERD